MERMNGGSEIPMGTSGETTPQAPPPMAPPQAWPQRAETVRPAAPTPARAKAAKSRPKAKPKAVKAKGGEAATLMLEHLKQEPMPIIEKCDRVRVDSDVKG